jgi:hypothetical protein
MMSFILAPFSKLRPPVGSFSTLATPHSCILASPKVTVEVEPFRVLRTGAFDAQGVVSRTRVLSYESIAPSVGFGGRFSPRAIDRRVECRSLSLGNLIRRCRNSHCRVFVGPMVVIKYAFPSSSCNLGEASTTARSMTLQDRPRYCAS